MYAIFPNAYLFLQGSGTCLNNVIYTLICGPIPSETETFITILYIALLEFMQVT